MLLERVVVVITSWLIRRNKFIVVYPFSLVLDASASVAAVTN